MSDLDLSKPLVYVTGVGEEKPFRLLCSNRKSDRNHPTATLVGLVDNGDTEIPIYFSHDGSMPWGSSKIKNKAERRSFFQNCYGDINILPDKTVLGNHNQGCAVWHTRQEAEVVGKSDKFGIRAVIEYVMEDGKCVDIILHKTWKESS